VLATIPVESPAALAARGGRLYALHRSGEAWFVRSVELEKGLPKGDWDKVVRVQGATKPEDLDVDSHGRIYICDPTANHVYRLNADGTVAKRFGRLDTQKSGRYDPESFLCLVRLSTWTDGQGQDRVIVLEQDGPMRLSEWSADGALVRDWFTLQSSCNHGFAVDPREPEHLYMMGGPSPGADPQHSWLVRYRVDYTRGGTWKVDAVWPDVTLGHQLHWDPLHIGYPKIVYIGARKYLTFGRGYAVYRFDGDRLIPSAGVMNYVPPGKESHQAEIHAWHDANGDGRIQEAEWRDQPLAGASRGLFGYWGDCWQDDLSLLMSPSGGRTVWRMAPASFGGLAEFDAYGNPIYKEVKPLVVDPVMQAKADHRADALHGGNEVGDTFGESWHSAFLTPTGELFTDIRGSFFDANHGHEQKITRYVPDGKGGYRLKWRIGRSANIAGHTNGAIVGSIWVMPPAHGLFAVIDQTLAGCHVFTADEGLYVDTLMVPGVGDTAYSSPGEFFAGMTFHNTQNDKVYLGWGKVYATLLEVEGWTKANGIRRLTTLPKTVTLMANQIADPPPAALLVRGGAGKAPYARFTPSAGGEPALDGSLSGWESCEPVVFGDGRNQVEVRGMHMLDTLFLRWQVTRESPLALKPAEPLDRIFTHDRGADTFSFYLQCDAAAKGNAIGGRPGDVRIVAGLFEQNGTPKPALLGLYPKWSGLAGQAKAQGYGSLVSKAQFEHVGPVAGARLGYTMAPDRKSYAIAAAIPRAALPSTLPEFAREFRTMANFDANFGGRSKVFWSLGDGSASLVTDDEPSEARLYPGSWAPLVFTDLVEGLVVRKWQVVGPFGFPDLQKLDSHHDRNKILPVFAGTVFPPEQEIDLTTIHEGDLTTVRSGRKKVRWIPCVLASTDEVNFREVLEPHAPGIRGGNDMVFYAATWIDAPEPVEVKLMIDAGKHGHSGVCGWLNGKLLPSTGNAAMCQHRIDTTQPVKLEAGRNLFLFRYDLIWGSGTLSVRLNAAPEALWKLKIVGAPDQTEH